MNLSPQYMGLDLEKGPLGLSLYGIFSSKVMSIKHHIYSNMTHENTCTMKVLNLSITK